MSASPRFRAFLFDLDGTLVDSYRAIQASVNHVRAARGLAPLPMDPVRAAVGDGLAKLLERTVGEGDPAGNAAAYHQHHPSVLESGTDLLPEVRATLQTLFDRGAKLGVCSNKPLAFTQRLLEILGVSTLFDAVYGPELVLHPKPAPDMLVAAIRKLGAEPSEALYVGDMTIDVAAARAAGVAVWVIPTGSHSAAELAKAKPDRLMDRFSELAAEG